jgi:hypothetical protein
MVGPYFTPYALPCLRNELKAQREGTSKRKREWWVRLQVSPFLRDLVSLLCHVVYTVRVTGTNKMLHSCLECLWFDILQDASYLAYHECFMYSSFREQCLWLDILQDASYLAYHECFMYSSFREQCTSNLLLLMGPWFCSLMSKRTLSVSTTNPTPATCYAISSCVAPHSVYFCSKWTRK